MASQTSILRSIALTLALSSATPYAENNGDESIELIVADSDVVVRGTIERVTVTKGPGDVVYETATAKVAEVLKGDPAEQVAFFVRHLAHEDVPSKWKEQNVELILCLVRSERYKGDDPRYQGCPLALRHRWGKPSAFHLDGKAKVGAFTIGFEELTRRDEILAAARAAAKVVAGKTKPKELRVDVPFGTPVFQKLDLGSSVFLVVPVDERLEAEARKWIGSQDSETRHQGAVALGHFKSEDNARLLKTLLADKGFCETPSEKKRTYYVRQAAYRALKAWGVAVAAPAMEELFPPKP